MGAHGGPNMVEDGMVFGYDTGNSKSYAGEPTTNFADTDAKRSWGTHGGATSTTEDAPEKGPGWKKLIITDINGSNYRLAQFPYLTQADGTTRTYSVEYDLGNLTGYFLFVDGTSGYDQTSVSGRGRYSATIGPVSGAKNISIFLGRSGTSNNINHVIYYRDYQVEEKSHATQFTAGTRSATQGLVDFKDSTTLDLSNVSFDSDAQMTFDGTSDKINLADAAHLKFPGGSFTIEQVLIVDAISSKQRTFSKGSSSWSRGWHAAIRPTQWEFELSDGVSSPGNSFKIDTTTTVGTNHVAWVIENGATAKLYINGVQAGSTQTITEGIDFATTTSTVGIGAYELGAEYFNGKIPYTKLYNKALTAEEVQNNFNGIRNRFGI